MPAESSGLGSACVFARMAEALTGLTMTGVVKHRMKAVAEVLAMGGELDSDEEAELKDTTKLEFDEVRAYLESVAGLAGSAAESAEVLR